jgi:predicted RNA polymerase sigma factor
VHGAEIGLEELSRIAAVYPEPFQPQEAVRAHLLAKLGREAEAREAYDVAISLTIEPRVRGWLLGRRREVV